jgi:hypothetical protein
MTHLLRLSQGHLNLLEICPPQFQRIYLEQLASPLSPEQQEKLTWGNQFHLLMQQRELHLPIATLLGGDGQLRHSLMALVEAAPAIRQVSGETWREAEHCRTLSFGRYLLTTIYDLLITSETKAQILDWKTYLQPENGGKLAKNWQTRLYLYVLAETSAYLPEQISMTYWFVKLPTKPRCLTFPYSRSQHEQTRQDLAHLLTQLDTWLDDYSDRGTPFPHRPNCSATCPFYPSLVAPLETSASDRAPRTARGNRASLNDWLTSLDAIDEIAIE